MDELRREKAATMRSLFGRNRRRQAPSPEEIGSPAVENRQRTVDRSIGDIEALSFRSDPEFSGKVDQWRKFSEKRTKEHLAVDLSRG